MVFKEKCTDVSKNISLSLSLSLSLSRTMDYVRVMEFKTKMSTWDYVFRDILALILGITLKMAVG